MIVFNGVLAAFFYCFLVGAIVPSRNNCGFSEYLLGCVGRSLWISWLAAFASFILGVPLFFLFAFFVSFLAVGVVSWRILKKRPIFPVRTLDVPNGMTLAILCVAFGFGALLTLNIVLGNTYHSIFNTWDGIVSWNRWAVELSNGEYRPINGAYPILFPAIWSLVYRAQNDPSVWLVAKASMFILPILATLCVGVLIERKRIAAAMILAIFVFTFFFGARSEFFVDGMMDVPVAVMMLCAGTCLFLTLDSLEEGKNEDAGSGLILSATYAGLAAITKQPGALLIVLIAAASTLMFMRRCISARDLGVVGLLSIFPLVTFLVMYGRQEPDPIGNLAYLQSLAKDTPAGQNVWGRAYAWIKTMWHPQLLLFIGAVSFANLAFLRTASGIVGALFLALALTGGFIFADCCSYEPRNGWWILSLLTISCLFAVGHVDRLLPAVARRFSGNSWPQYYYVASFFVFSVAFAAALGQALPDKKIRTVQTQLQWRVLWPAVNDLIRRNADLIGDSKIVSSYQVLGWLPDMRDNYINCWNDEDCTIDQINRSDRTFILLNDLSAKPKLSQLIDNTQEVGEANGWSLYGPLVPFDRGPNENEQ